MEVVRLDEVTYAKCKMSAPIGYLQRTESGGLTFTKYKNQVSGRMNIFAWIIYKIVLAFMKDKQLISLEKSEIREVKYVKTGDGFLEKKFKWNELLVTAQDVEYKFLISNSYDQEKVNFFIEGLKK